MEGWEKAISQSSNLPIFHFILRFTLHASRFVSFHTAGGNEKQQFTIHHSQIERRLYKCTHV